MRSVLAAVLIIAGSLGCAYGVLIWISIASSDTSTASLIAYGAMVAVPGLAAIGAGAWLQRR